MMKERLSIDDKMFLRSIAILAKIMVDENEQQDRKEIADKINNLVEDYIASYK